MTSHNAMRILPLAAERHPTHHPFRLMRGPPPTAFAVTDSRKAARVRFAPFKG